MDLRNKMHLLPGLAVVIIITLTLFSGVGIAQTDENIKITIDDSKYGEDSRTTPIVIEDAKNNIPSDFPGSARQYNTIIEQYDEVSPISLARLVTDNAEQGNVGDVEFSPIELAQIIDWNATQ